MVDKYMEYTIFTVSIRTASLSKQQRTRADPAEYGVWSESTPFASLKTY